MVPKYIRIPVKIVTDKLPAKTDSIFYFGKTIASVNFANRKYILKQNGKYVFSLGDKKYNSQRPPKFVRLWKDHKLRYLERTGKIQKDSWGSFIIEVWIKNIYGNWYLAADGGEYFDTYDGGIRGLVEFIEKDKSWKVPH